MNISNKRLAFYVGLIAITAILGLLFTGHITIEQATIGLVAIFSIATPLAITDSIYDYLGIIFRVAEVAVSLTPSTEDDKKLAEIKEVALKFQPVPNTENIGSEAEFEG